MRPRDHERARQDQEAKERAHRSQLRDSWLSTVPGEYRGRTMDDLDEGWNGRMGRAQIASIRRYLATGGTRFLLLQGRKGVGKTTLAVTLATELVETLGVPASFKNALMLMSGFSFDGGESLRQVSEVPILVLDDLGAANEGMTPHQERSLWAMIEARWSNPEFRTLITTNMAIGDNTEGIGLATWLGPSAWDRVADSLTRVELRGESLRGE